MSDDISKLNPDEEIGVHEIFPVNKEQAEYYRNTFDKLNKRILEKIKVKQANIVELKVDAVVNAAAADLQGGGGVDWAIHEAAGTELQKYLHNHKPIEPGQVVITPGFKLPAKYIIHTLGPVYEEPSAEKDIQLKNCYINCLALADKNDLKSIAFCLISSGVFGYPKDLAAKLALQGIREYFDSIQSMIQKVILVAYTEEEYKILSDQLKAK